LKLEFAKACREALVTHQIEPEFAPGDFADIAFFPANDPDESARALVDFTVTSSLSKSKASEEEAQRRKHQRYKNGDLVVAQIDVTGGMSNAMVKLMSDIAFFSDDETFLSRLRAAAAKTVQRFNGLILRRASLKSKIGASVVEEIVLRGANPAEDVGRTKKRRVAEAKPAAAEAEATAADQTAGAEAAAEALEADRTAAAEEEDAALAVGGALR
jgi:hypothetical protein